MYAKLVSTLALLAVAGGCANSPTAPAIETEGMLTLEVSGGIAAASYAFELTNTGAVVGTHCTRLCRFQAGDTLVQLTPAQLSAVMTQIDVSGIAEIGDPMDYGTPCCDQFTYTLTYTDGTVPHSVAGADETLPPQFSELVRTMRLLYQATPPLVHAQGSALGGYRKDALGILDAQVDGSTLILFVTYGGGCERHDLDAVTFDGFLESNPLQAHVAVAHDAHGDMCKAAIQRTLLFDLEPLRKDYEALYRSKHGTVILDVEPANLLGQMTPLQVTYTF